MDDAVYWQHLDTNPRIKRLLQALNFLQNVKQRTNIRKKKRNLKKRKTKVPELRLAAGALGSAESRNPIS